MRNSGNAIANGAQWAFQGETSAVDRNTPKLSQSLNRMNDALERGAQILQRQQMFVDRLCGSQPQPAADKSTLRGEPSSVLARIEANVDLLEILLNAFNDSTHEMECLA